MNLVELYAKIPVERHKDIKVVEDKVFVKDADGCVDEYLISAIDEGEELWLIRSDGEQKQALEAIKAKLGISK